MFVLENVVYKDIIRYPYIAIAEGGATFICGESGCGKSTLLKLLNGVCSADSGTMTYLGNKIETLDPIALRREVLLIGHSVYLFDKSIRKNFDTYYAYRDLQPIGTAIMAQFLDICAVNLPLDSACGVLSGGERQRIFMAINLSYRPNVLLMDEPTSALDDKNAHLLMHNVKAYCRANGMTLIVVSHDRQLAEKYADRMIDLTGGVAS